MHVQDVAYRRSVSPPRKRRHSPTPRAGHGRESTAGLSDNKNETVQDSPRTSQFDAVVVAGRRAADLDEWATASSSPTKTPLPNFGRSATVMSFSRVQSGTSSATNAESTASTANTADPGKPSSPLQAKARPGAMTFRSKSAMDVFSGRTKRDEVAVRSRVQLPSKPLITETTSQSYSLKEQKLFSKTDAPVQSAVRETREGAERDRQRHPVQLQQSGQISPSVKDAKSTIVDAANAMPAVTSARPKQNQHTKHLDAAPGLEIWDEEDDEEEWTRSQRGGVDRFNKGGQVAARAHERARELQGSSMAAYPPSDGGTPHQMAAIMRKKHRLPWSIDRARAAVAIVSSRPTFTENTLCRQE
jgi:hypothetical protein